MRVRPCACVCPRACVLARVSFDCVLASFCLEWAVLQSEETTHRRVRYCIKNPSLPIGYSHNMFKRDCMVIGPIVGLFYLLAVRGFQASIGIAKLLLMAMSEKGLTKEQALSKIWMVDSKGLIVKVSMQRTVIW